MGKYYITTLLKRHISQNMNVYLTYLSRYNEIVNRYNDIVYRYNEKISRYN